jgi:hypothetical protein
MRNQSCSIYFKGKAKDVFREINSVFAHKTGTVESLIHEREREERVKRMFLVNSYVDMAIDTCNKRSLEARDNKSKYKDCDYLLGFYTSEAQAYSDVKGWLEQIKKYNERGIGNV